MQEQMHKLKSAADLEKLRQEVVAQGEGRTTLSLCAGTGCLAYGAKKVHLALLSEMEKSGVPGDVVLKKTGCHGFCEKGPLLVIYPRETCYINVKSEDAVEIVEKTVLKGEVIERLLWKQAETPCVMQSDIPFYKHQTRMVIANNSKIDPAMVL